MKRESGWYWVKIDGLDWEIADYESQNTQWYRNGVDPDNCEYFDSDFEQIDERRIVRPEPEVTK